MTTKTVDKNWYDGFVWLELSQGLSQYKIQNKGTGVLVIQFTNTPPDPDNTDGYQIYPQESFILPLSVSNFYIRAYDYSCNIETTESYNMEDLSVLPQDLYSSTKAGVRRLQVDHSQTGFWDGREFRIFEPIDLSGTGRKVIRIVAATDFVLRWQALSAKSGSIVMKAYRLADGGTDTGTWADTIYKLPNNIMSDVEPYTPQVAYQTGGNFVPTDIDLYRDKLEVLVSNATAQQSTVGANTAQERGLSVNTYYLVFTGNGIGDFFSIIEERNM
jgi:hypothetical protein